jgi:hypothetical protein
LCNISARWNHNDRFQYKLLERHDCQPARGGAARGGRAALRFWLASAQLWLLPLVAVTPYALLAWARPGMFTNHRIGEYLRKLVPFVGSPR